MKYILETDELVMTIKPDAQLEFEDDPNDLHTIYCVNYNEVNPPIQFK